MLKDQKSLHLLDIIFETLIYHKIFPYIIGLLKLFITNYVRVKMKDSVNFKCILINFNTLEKFSSKFNFFPCLKQNL